MTDSKGFVVAVIRWAPGQRPCRWTCPCTHAVSEEQTEPCATTVPKQVQKPAPQAQLWLFDAPVQANELPRGKATS